MYIGRYLVSKGGIVLVSIELYLKVLLLLLLHYYYLTTLLLTAYTHTLALSWWLYS